MRNRLITQTIAATKSGGMTMRVARNITPVAELTYCTGRVRTAIFQISRLMGIRSSGICTRCSIRSSKIQPGMAISTPRSRLPTMVEKI